MPGGSSVFYDVFGVYAFSRNELVAMAVALIATIGLAALFHVHARRAAHAGRRREPADDRAQRHRRRPRVGGRLGAVLVLRRPRRRADRPAVHHPVVRRVLQPRRRRHRRRGASARWSACRARSLGGLGLGILDRPVQHVHPEMERRLHRGWRRSRTTSRRRSRSSCCSACWCSCRASASRGRATDPLAGVDPPPSSQAQVVADPQAHADPDVRSASHWSWWCSAVVLSRGDSAWIFLVTQAVVLATVFLSITVITGFGRAHLALPGRVRRHRRVHHVPAGRPLRRTRARRRVDRCGDRRRRGRTPVAAAPAVSTASGSRSPRSRSPTSSTR